MVASMNHPHGSSHRLASRSVSRLPPILLWSLGLLAQGSLQAQGWGIQGGFITPFAEMKARNQEASATFPGPRIDAFSNGFSLQATAFFPGQGRIGSRGTIGICGMNGTSTSVQRLDLSYLAYGVSAGWQVALGSQAGPRGPYAFSELHFDKEFYEAKVPGTSWASLYGGRGSRTCIRVGLGVGLGWMAPDSGLTFEVEARASLTGPISDASESNSTQQFWANLPPDRYLRVGVGWTWGRGPR
jgi:hypothetical protein